ncbi:MAG: hypothetical protein N4A57_09930 [Anaeromicrobium sp.]|jgi:hypothetical protein|uniref:hypothetical protein n=1 Tax=Anaeromicrobium sp. TaxID=1929132 RepID=UPI0025F7EDDF|nr:hypothetical protein [Anaeromicrobium sp.]MCT4594568.1 hypothetical protein [Anaeromicrobium sp.]
MTKSAPLTLALSDKCCEGHTGCEFDGTLKRVCAESVYLQKVYDATLFNLQGLKNAAGHHFKPYLGDDVRIIRVLDIRCKKVFNPHDINDPDNLNVDLNTTVSGASFVENEHGPIRVVGPDGRRSEFILYTDTSECDDEYKGTPIFGTQVINITGKVLVEIDVVYSDDCDCECTATLRGEVPIGTECDPLVLTNFFELCMPSVFNSAFLPRFTEFCNVGCEARLATNSITRDIVIDPCTGCIKVNLIIAICVTCEKKIIVPVQLCVLSTGFPCLKPNRDPICSSFPQLFPDNINRHCKPCKPCASDQSLEEEPI